MQDTIFREYDIRGIVGKELFLDDVYDLVRAIAYYFVLQNFHVKNVAVGMDGRTHSPAIKKEVCRALADSGLNVLFVGVCPSPVLCFALHQCQVDAGLMITASHNPAAYNGIKISLGTHTVWGAQIQEIKRLYQQKKHIQVAQKGVYTERFLVSEYVDWLAEHFQSLKNISLPVVFDCGNAAAGVVLPLLVEKMCWKNVQILYAEVDGTFPHHEADPTVLANMQDLHQAVQKSDAQLGIGFDGDADRVGAVTADGFLIAGDRLLALFASDMVQDNPHMGVVFNVTTSAGLIELLKLWQVRQYMVPTGHAIIKEKMHEVGALLGGEVSCHFFFNDRYFGYDDGIYAALRLLEIIHKTGRSLSQLVAIFPHKESSQEYRIACAEEEKKSIVAAVAERIQQQHPEAELLLIDGVRAILPYGWGIVRASNTQPAISARFESDTKEGLQKIKNDFIEILKDHIADKALEQLRN